MKENDIEEARERLEKRLKDIWFSTTYSQEQEEKDLKILLLDYKRVLKENEILKEEKEQAWEEWNNLEQGSYETEQKIKQQIKKLQKENEEVKRLIAHKNEYTKKLEEDLFENAENYVISKQKVKDKIRHYQELQDNYIKKYDEINEGLQAMINALQELIEEREVKEYDKEDIIPKNKKGSI